MYLIFDLDQTLFNTSIAEPHRKARNWSHVYSLIPEMEMYTGMKDVFEHIHNNKSRVAIVTSSPRPYCEKVIKHHGLNVDTIIGFHDASPRKPDPAPILAALTRLGNPPVSEVYSFGDTAEDIIASSRAGVHSVACLWGSANHNSILAANPEYVLNSPQELIDFLHKINA